MMLPHSILILCLLLISEVAHGAAIPQGGNTGVDLTTTTFTDKLSNGMWLVEYFSPYCSHCKRFMPTWKNLVEMHEHLADSSNFHFGRVNCVEQMDLCTKEKVAGYPSMYVYTDGKKTDDYTKDRSFELLSTFVLEHAAQYKKLTAAKVQAHTRRR